MKRLLIAMIAVLVAFPAYANEAWRMGKVQTMYFNAASKEITTAFATQTRHVRIVTNQDAYVAFVVSGGAATAYARGTTSFYMVANVPEYFVVSPGMTIAAIRATTDGTISITEISK